MPGDETVADEPAEPGHDEKRPWWAKITGSMIVAVLALVVSVAGTTVSLVQTHIARDEASTAAKALNNTVTQQRYAYARKVSFDSEYSVTGLDTLTLTNAGTLPIRDIDVYLTEKEGKPIVAYVTRGHCARLQPRAMGD